MLLAELVRRVSGRSLDAFAAAEIFGPLGMTNIGAALTFTAETNAPTFAPALWYG